MSSSSLIEVEGRGQLRDGVDKEQHQYADNNQNGDAIQ
jgi:hypothetical protein